MPSNIEIQLDKSSLNLSPGEAAEVRATLTNRGSVVDAYVLQMSGIDPTWYTLSANEVRLFPGQSSQVVAKLQPQGTQALAGTHGFSLVAVSRDNPAVQAVASGTITLAAVGGTTLGLEPKRVQGRKGAYAVTLTNGGNAALPLVLLATDPEEALAYTFGTPHPADAARTRPGASGADAPQPVVMGKPVASANGSIEHELELPAGASMVVPIEVTPRKRIWTGRERTFAVTVGTHPPGVEWDVNDAQRVQGELVYKPVFAALAALPLTLRRVLAVAIPLAVLALLLFLLFKPNNNDKLVASVHATQTAQAAAAAAAQTAQALAANAAGGNSATQTAQALAANTSASQTALALAAGAAGSSSNSSPSIQSFEMVVPTPNTGQGGAPVSDSPNLQYDVSSAHDVRVDQSSTSANLPGLETSTLLGYQLVATGTNGVTTDTLTVLLLRPAAINSFTASATTVTAGQSTVLSWDVKGAKSLTLDGSSVALTPSGGGSVSITPGTTHRYILCATNVVGTVCTSVKITVLGGATATVAPATAISAGHTSEAATASSTLTPVPTPCQVDSYQIGQASETAIISGTTDIGLNCDNCTSTIQLPFQFRLYDKSFTQAIVGSNGTLGFVENGNAITNTALTASGFSYAIMPNWDDLTTLGAGLGVFTSISSSAPNRIFNIEWRAHYPNGGTANFEVRLIENSPVQQFDVVYGHMDDSGKSSTVGVEKTAGANFTQYEFNSSAIDSGLALSFTLACGDGGGVDTTGVNVPSKSACLLGRITNPIANSSYLADHVTVQAGTTVHWTNIDNKIHTTTSVNGLWDSGALVKNEGFDYTFTTPGTYTYHSTTDSSLTGTVVVIASCASPTATQTETGTATQTSIATLLPTGTASNTSTSVATLTGTVPTGTSTATTTHISTSTVTPSSTTRPPSGGHATRPPAPPPPPPPPATPSCQPGTGYSIIPSSGATIMAGTTDTGNHCDDCANTVSLPFAVQLYDQSFSAATLSSNGTMQFVSSDATSSNRCLPAAVLNYAIAPYWDDLTTACTGCGIYTSVSGSAPNRTLNVEWRAQEAGAVTPTTVPVRHDTPPAKKEVAHSPSRVVSDLTIPGSPISVIVRDSGAYGVYRNNVQQFYGGYAEGTYLWVQAPGGPVQVWGPEYVPAGRDPNTYTPISNSMTGDGSASNPYVVTTVLGVGTTGLQLTQRVSYTNGDEYIRNDWSIANTGNTNYTGLHMFHAADLYTAGSDAGYGYYDPATGAIGGLSQDRSLYQIFSPITAASHYEENGYSTIWSNIGDTAGPGTGFHDIYFPDQYFDNGAGLEWQFDVRPHGSANQADFVSFSNQPVIPTSGVNFEIQLHETAVNKEFDVVYGQVNGNGDSATVGVQAGTGTSFTQLECNTGGISQGMHLAFVQSACGTPLVTVTTTPSTTTSATVTTTPSRTSTTTMVPTGTPTTTSTLTTTSTETATSTLTATSTDTASATPTPTGCVIDNYQISQSSGNITPGTSDIGNHCNDCVTGLGLPFPVRVYGETYNSLNVSSNGNLQFNSTDPNATNSCLPASGFSTSIFPYWDDLDTTGGAHGAPGGVIPGVYTSVTGVAPNRIFNIEWRAYAVNGAQANKAPSTPTVPIKVPQATGTVTVTATPTQCATGGGPWSFVAPLPSAVSGNAGAGDDTNFYSVGGFQSDGAPTPSTTGANTYQYSAASNSWNALAPAPVVGRSMSAVDTGGKVYAFGGIDSDIYRSNTQIFDPAVGQWSQGAGMPSARFGTYAGAYNGKIFVAGGKLSLFAPADAATYEYDIQTNSYTTPTLMTRPNAEGAYVTMGQYLYTFGGSNGNQGGGINAEANRLDMSNPGLGWTSLTSMPLSFRGASASVVGDKIWIFGGEDSSFNYTGSTFIYDPVLDTYTAGPTLNIPRADFAGGNVGTHSIAAGGNTPNLLTNTTELSDFVPCATSTATQTGTSTASPTLTRTNTSTATPTSTFTNTPSPTPVPVYVNFEVQLYENSVTSPSQAFDVIYGSTGKGTGVTVGAQKDSGTRVAQYECNTGGLSGGLQLNFALPPCGSVTPSTTVTTTVTTTATGTPTRTTTRTATLTGTATATTIPACVVTNSTDVPMPIPDRFGVVTSTLSIQSPGTISSIRVVNLGLDKVSNDTPDNMRATLISPSGSQVVLLDWACPTLPYTGTMNVTLDDGASTNINTTYCNQTISGTYHPDPGSLSTLSGQPAQGLWQLRVETQASTGQLNSWGLDICYLSGGQQQGSPTATVSILTPSATVTRAPGIGQRPTSTATSTAPPAISTAPPTHTPTYTATEIPTHSVGSRPTSTVAATATSRATVGHPPPPSQTSAPAPPCDIWSATRPSTLPASGGIIRSTVSVPRQGTIASVRVGVDVQKDAGTVLAGYLVSPGGEQIKLFDWSCGSSLNSRSGSRMNVTFDDAAPRGIDQEYCAAGISGAFRPDPGALDDLSGANSAGTWTLVLETTGPATTSGGKLNRWSLQICFENGAALETGSGYPVDSTALVADCSLPPQASVGVECLIPPDEVAARR